MARSKDLAQDVSGKLPALVILRSSSELGAPVSQPAAKAVQPRAERLDLTLCLGELRAVPAQPRNAEEPGRAHRTPEAGRSARLSEAGRSKPAPASVKSILARISLPWREPCEVREASLTRLAPQIRARRM